MEDAAEGFVHMTKTIHPEPELAARYEAQHQKFRQIYPAVRRSRRCFRRCIEAVGL